jgi:RNA polymerase sigma factor (sigma-70 family)
MHCEMDAGFFFLSAFCLAGCYRLRVMTDGELLRRYAELKSEEAFAELVGRHVDLVYSSALRQVGGDAHLAKDVAQSVFTDLARRAAQLSDREVLAGWLYTSTHFAAAKTVRAERRRRTHEEEAHAMNELNRNPALELDWEAIRPALDEGMVQLSEADRDVILLRYFENRALAEVGQRLGVSEEAARKRVDRALEKLRRFLSKRGIKTSATLATALSANAVQLAPAGLAGALASASVASASMAGGGTAAVLKIVTMTKLQASIATVVIVAVTTSLIVQHQSKGALKRENESLREQVAQLSSANETLSRNAARARRIIPQLPAPALQVSTTVDTNEPTQSTNLYERLKEKPSKLSAEQVEPYLNANRRNAASLLAAYRTTGDAALLEEAMKKFPNDPQVSFEAVFRKEGTPEERRKWLDGFKKADPNNAMANYLSARDYFKNGQTDKAVEELLAASGKSFQDYTSERYQDDSEAYLAAGYSIADAKTVSSMQLLLPQLIELKQLAMNTVELANLYRQAGDNRSAQGALELAMGLGQRYSSPSPGEAEVSQLVGMAIERKALGAMDPTAAFGNEGGTVQDRIQQIQQQEIDLKEMNQRVELLFQTMSEHDWVSYRDRWLMFGEENAARWVINKYGER